MSFTRSRILPSAAAAIALSCSPPPVANPPVQCEGLSRQASPTSAPARWVVGQASRYPADTALSGRAEELRHSQRARRAAAWEAVARTLAPVAVAQSTQAPTSTLPRFRTWYDSDDLTRLFQRLYGNLDAAGRASRAHFSDAALDDALGWNALAATTLEGWDPTRLSAFASGVHDNAALAALGGSHRIAVSPDAARHLLNSYPEVLNCIANGAPPAFLQGGTAPAQQMAREPVRLGTCAGSTSAPFFVAQGGTLRAVVEGTTSDTAQLSILAGEGVTARVRCNASAGVGCSVDGPGIFTVQLASGGRELTGTLAVSYSTPTPELASCLHGVFPASAATVAQEWRRADLGFVFPTFDTSAAGMQRRLGPGGDASWGAGDGMADPGPDRAYTMQLPSGGVFRLAGMHIRTREVDRWLHITLWWSPNPDDDFGADRPASVRALGAPWSNYKMCVASDFDEQDTDPAGGLAEQFPSLGAALRAVNEGRGGPSWCSNPYIDGGPGLVRSNCVGCHQHALSGVRPGDVQNDPAAYPANGRLQTRNNFPGDGFWGLDGGDQYASIFAQTVDWWRSMQ